MGFLRRLFGGGDATPSTIEVALNVNYFTRIRPDAVLDVVGEAHRQQNVAAIRPPSETDLPPGLPPPPAGQYKAMLTPEPTNQYDPNAVTVVAWAGGAWALVGYLSRESAIAYGPVFRYLAKPEVRPAIACDAAMVRERGGIGVILHLGSPGECMAELLTDDRQPSDHPWRGKAIAFTGSGRSTIAGAVVDRPTQLMLASWAGCDVLPRVTKRVEALIAADSREVTGNISKARDYGIPVVDEREWLVGIGLSAERVGVDDLAWARSSGTR